MTESIRSSVIAPTPESAAGTKAGGCPEPEADAATRARQQMDEIIDSIAGELYNLASMLVGEGEEGVRLVELAIDQAEVSACQNPRAARKSTRRGLTRAAVAYLAAADPEAFAAPEGTFHPTTCIEDDDLESAGMSVEQLESMFAGPERERVRQWLVQLSPSIRTVFILRAVAGQDANEAASILAEFGGPKAAGWQPEAVRHVFRQGLCSLASQLLQASTQKQ
jgi:DNA-directed RNA polymerase specialized sigma24 family protein